MTTAEILEECNKRYPIGSIIKYMDSEGKTWHKHREKIKREARTLSNSEDGDTYTTVDMGGGYVYANGVFVEIVEYPPGYVKKEEINNTYIEF